MRISGDLRWLLILLVTVATLNAVRYAHHGRPSVAGLTSQRRVECTGEGIALGMGPDEVRRIAGPPKKMERQERAAAEEFWTYPDGFVCFNDHQVSCVCGHVLQLGDEVLIHEGTPVHTAVSIGMTEGRVFTRGPGGCRESIFYEGRSQLGGEQVYLRSNVRDGEIIDIRLSYKR